MSTIQDTQSAANLFASYGTTNTSKPVADEVQDRFLKLLVTQMKNQDPLNPLDNAQVTTQLAQISTVNGIEKLNANIQAMASSFNAGQSLQAATMIGKDVLVPGSMLQLTGGSGIFGLELPHAADQVKVTIHDASGRAMQVMDLGAKPAGSMALAWDGMTADGAPATDGAYSISVSALRGDQKIDAKTLAFGSVQGVSQSSQGVQLNVGMLGLVGLTDVKQIF
ncbi:flagellar hook assembly protein FlgD [Nitrosovibrio sp. Nv4]|uniref:flagellar hook assembly protein FlgD n=1 Tax=Nitrosovibrio sp. Nv4 TaxID=1945880 RepID=UPI000BD2987E|nr:flagellar hook assembly protein FlgD [Nitrosovibrio sp. Nv4]SOD41556.1 flagellar basal-body rod modification protein FlgD [Nitrosovibrio sp. Nv4]